MYKFLEWALSHFTPWRHPPSPSPQPEEEEEEASDISSTPSFGSSVAEIEGINNIKTAVCRDIEWHITPTPSCLWRIHQILRQLDLTEAITGKRSPPISLTIYFTDSSPHQRPARSIILKHCTSALTRHLGRSNLTVATQGWGKPTKKPKPSFRRVTLCGISSDQRLEPPMGYGQIFPLDAHHPWHSQPPTPAQVYYKDTSTRLLNHWTATMIRWFPGLEDRIEVNCLVNHLHLHSHVNLFPQAEILDLPNPLPTFTYCQEPYQEPNSKESNTPRTPPTPPKSWTSPNSPSSRSGHRVHLFMGTVGRRISPSPPSQSSPPEASSSQTQSSQTKRMKRPREATEDAVDLIPVYRY